jgi:hypothetical protein
MKTVNTTTIKSLSEFMSLLETRIMDKYRITLFRGQTTDKALIPKIARHIFKKSREVDGKRMLDEFNIHSIQYLTYHPKNELEQLTIAQHYGLPTRLLDWTDNALAALYFAVCDEPKDEDQAVIWVLSIERDSELLITEPNIKVFEQKTLRLFKPASIIPRVSSQFGWFTLHPFQGQGFYERADKTYNETVRINKVVIAKDCSRRILGTLESCGINRHSIFKDLDSLGQYVFEKYKHEKK